MARVRARTVTIQFSRGATAFRSIVTFDPSRDAEAQAKSGLPAATAASAVATMVITQFSLRVAFISYLGFLVVSFCSQFRKGLSPKSRQKPAVPGEISEGRGYEWGGLAARGSRAVPGGLVAASPLDCVSYWLHLGSSSLPPVSQVALAGFSPESARDSAYANKGLPAATAARAVATTVITQFSLRVAFISYLGLLVISLWSQFRKRLSPVSRQKIVTLATKRKGGSPLPLPLASSPLP